MSDTFPYDTLGPLEGFRIWRVSERALVAVSRSSEWPAGESMTAECPSSWRDDGPPPHARGHCGIYAGKELDLLLPPPRVPPEGFADSVRDGSMVLGRAKLWGKVYEHECGWRAQHAYPLGLYPTWQGHQAETKLSFVLARYGIEILPMPEELSAVLGSTRDPRPSGSKPGTSARRDEDPPAAVAVAV